MITKYLTIVTYILVLCRCINSTADKCEIAQICVTDYSQADCFGDQVLVHNSHISGCCPSCQNPVTTTASPVVTLPPTSTGCSAPSNCLPDGRFAPVQCKGDRFTGRCFCSDDQGNRIFGQMWRSVASEMTCACSRQRFELESSTKRSVTLHCTPSGDYEPLQCDDGMCWCAQSHNGQPTAGPVPETDMRRLPCYSSTVTGENYLRRCESIVHSIARIHQEQTEHGTSFLGNPITFCDYDGSYGSYQIENGIAYCTGRDGKILGSWQIAANERTGMNCNCARDSAIYFPAHGMTMTEMCEANGNYRPNQNVGNIFYCVDTDGYPTTGFLDAWPTDRCRSFAAVQPTTPAPVL